MSKNKSILLSKCSSKPYSADSGTGTSSGGEKSLDPIKEHTIDISVSEKKDEDSAVVKKDKSGPKAFLYIQMQLCRKDTLKEWLKDTSNSRDTSAVKTIFGQIVDAVNHIHSSGLMHRDLKVMITKKNIKKN